MRPETETTEVRHWCGRPKQHSPHAGCDGSGLFTGAVPGPAVATPVRHQRKAEPAAFTCPRCERTSYNPNDAVAGYCGACHDWTGAGGDPGGDPWHQTHIEAGYILCRAHGEYHRPPECPIDEQGQPVPQWADETGEEG